VAKGENGQVRASAASRACSQARDPAGFSWPKASNRICACSRRARLTHPPHPMHRPDLATSLALRV
jgi:hypothetical protein